MIQLPNGCRRSEFNVVPKNWKTSKAKVSDTWYFECRFIDPVHQSRWPKGKITRVKAGINLITKLSDKKSAMSALIAEFERLFDDGYNPIIENEIKIPEPVIGMETPITEVIPSTPFIKAFRFSLTKSQNVKETIADTKSVLNSLEAAAQLLGFLTIPIGEIEVKHIKLTLDQCHKSNSKFSAKRFNKAKSYLSGLFRYLVEVGAAHGNIALAISPMKEEITEPVHFSDADIKKIKKHLWQNNRPFYKFMMMFYYSGGRIKEFMRLQGKHVDLNEQTYKTLVKKGKQRWVERTIRDIALPYWKEQMKNCGQNDYVFSSDLLPGPEPINSKQITRRWMLHVKVPLGIVATFYKLKHLQSDRTVKAAGVKMAAGQMGHTSSRMAEEVYSVNEKKRIHETLKGLDIEL